MILRSKTKFLFDRFEISEEQRQNTELNISEIESEATILQSFPRRLVLELTNACNLNCIMCGRNSSNFENTVFKLEWLDKFKQILDKTEEVALFGWGEPTMHPQFTELLKILNHYPIRKYFCTNGMKLDKLKDAIFDYNVDIIAVSIDGAKAETNDQIRRGSNLNKISESLKDIVEEKKRRNTQRPYINFVFCAMESNIEELPDVVKLADTIGIEEVKVVYLTAFGKELEKETLWNKTNKVKLAFESAAKIADEKSIKLKLPYMQGEDEAEDKYHRDCFVGWRDLFLGSDGFVRPCMSTPVKFFNINDHDSFEEMWNHEKYQELRKTVNSREQMSEECSRCYQSSHCNWNKKESFVQIGEKFAPEWKKTE